jgi:hypothetical protein
MTNVTINHRFVQDDFTLKHTPLAPAEAGAQDLAKRWVPGDGAPLAGTNG